MLMLECLQPSTVGILGHQRLQAEVILKVCLEVTLATVVFTKALYCQSP